MKTSELETTTTARNRDPYFLPECIPTGRYVESHESQELLMSERHREISLPILFEPEVSFTVRPTARTASIDPVSIGLARLKKTELQRHRNTLRVPFKRRLIHSALNEAESIAWASPYPLLVFPELAKEKAAWATHYIRRQEEIWRRDRLPIALAA